ncbi:hypothetical protein C8Q78DRAFT_10165 [Trametes maxima]|nr:hypothetical protein C8Q78DRAFT_10165 [Trametes maxima]
MRRGFTGAARALVLARMGIRLQALGPGAVSRSRGRAYVGPFRDGISGVRVWRSTSRRIRVRVVNVVVPAQLCRIRDIGFERDTDTPLSLSPAQWHCTATWCGSLSLIKDAACRPRSPNPARGSEAPGSTKHRGAAWKSAQVSAGSGPGPVQLEPPG